MAIANRPYRLYSSGGRSSWDQTAMLAAVTGPEPFFTLSAPGRMEVLAGGANAWRNGPDGRHRYLIKKAPDEEITAGIYRLMREERQ